MSQNVSAASNPGAEESPAGEGAAPADFRNSSRKTFLELHWEGKRFTHTQFPVSVAKELGIVESAVKALARDLWLKDSEKKRVPNGFFNQFNLFLDDIKDGCVNTVLVAGPAEEEQESLFPDEYQTVFDEALEIFLRVIAGEASREELTIFRSLDETLSFGKALGEGEEVKLVNKRSNVPREVTYSQAQRAAVRTKYGAEDELLEMQLFGWVSNIDEKGDVLVSTNGGETIRIITDVESSDWAQYKTWLAGKRVYRALRFEGIFLVDNQKRIKQAQAINAVDEAYPTEWHERVVALMALPPGWLGDESGHEISMKARSILDGVLSYFYEEEVLGDQRPGIYPLIRGGIQLEWEMSHVDWSIEIQNDGDVELSAFGDEIDIDEEIPFSVRGENFSSLVCAKLEDMILKVREGNK